MIAVGSFASLLAAPAWVSAVTAGQWGIKILLLIGVLGGVIYVSRLQGARNLALRRILALLFAIGAAAAIVWPASISCVARLLGVGRGTDLLLYALVVVVLATWLVQWRYNIAVQARLTELTRELALAEARAAGATRDQGHDTSQPAA